MNEQVLNDNNKEVFTHVLMIDLDYVAVNIREVEFESIKKGLEPKGVDLTQSIFSKSSMSPNHRETIKDILNLFGKKSDAIEKAVNEVNKSVADYCINHAKLNSGVQELIKSAQSRNVAVKLFSALDSVLSNNLLDKLGLSDQGIELINPDEIRESFPRADDWLKMLKKANIEDKTIVAVISSQLACKGALTAGAACIAIPDKYTTFQDFSGAKFTLEKLTDECPELLLDHTLRM